MNAAFTPSEPAANDKLAFTHVATYATGRPMRPGIQSPRMLVVRGAYVGTVGATKVAEGTVGATKGAEGAGVT
jgi:hypothetical protein